MDDIEFNDELTESDLKAAEKIIALVFHKSKSTVIVEEEIQAMSRALRAASFLIEGAVRLQFTQDRKRAQIQKQTVVG